MEHSFHPDRAAGVLLAQACGDALGVPYEFGPALPASFEPVMVGGGPFGFDPGEYSDDTAMAVCIAEVAATGADLTNDASLDEIAQRFVDWAAVSKDVGSQTRAVFNASHDHSGSIGHRVLDASRAHALAHPGRVGNGALMRTAIVGLTELHDRDATADAASAVAELTHADPLGLESCVLWSEAVRLAVTRGELDLLAGLDLIPAVRRDAWAQWIGDATDVDPRTFAKNGFTVWALQAAWAAITWTPRIELDPPAGRFPAQHLADATKNAVRAGDDTDTVAAIAGGLLGAYWGQSAVPLEWTRRIHGYGGHRASGLVSLAHRTAHGGSSTSGSWPHAARMTDPSYTSAELVAFEHPHDDGVVLGTYAIRDHGCDAVVSLCRIGTDDFAPPRASTRRTTSSCGWSTGRTPRTIRTSISSWPTPPAPSRPCVTRENASSSTA
jgi:ADP-ribosyl-[dinitrogen reductase] hydrolase